MTRGRYCSHPLTILMVLTNRTKLNKIDKYQDQIEEKKQKQNHIEKTESKLGSNHYLSQRKSILNHKYMNKINMDTKLFNT